MSREGTTPAVEAQGIRKVWGKTVAVDGISFRAEAGEFLVLLGPSGCGKSTTLRMVAGLEEVDAGRVLIQGRDVSRLPPAERQISMVFQSYALFPHLNVAENIVFGLKVRRVPKSERDQRMRQVAELTGLSDYLDRKPAQLSGGQRQRVAVGRALMNEPDLVLFDEPTSALDTKLGEQVMELIRTEMKDRGTAAVVVTHDERITRFTDRTVHIRDGVLEA